MAVNAIVVRQWRKLARKETLHKDSSSLKRKGKSMSSPVTQNVRAARIRIVQEHLDAENNHDLDAIMATFSPQPAFALNGMDLAGQDVIRGVYAGFGFGQRGSFSDISLEVKHWYFGDDSITTEMILRANHTGEWQGISATGRAVVVPLCAIFTFDDENKVASERAYFDAATVLQQIGVLQ
jgi:steroid delta-isomerase-like uncharacterized protein